MKTTHMAFGILCGVTGLLGGCGGDYYRVSDTTGEKLYYTTKIDHTRTGGVTFKDEKGGSKVTLQSSEVKSISKEEFEAGLKAPAKATPAKATSAPTPAVAPAAAPAPAPAAQAEAPVQPADSK